MVFSFNRLNLALLLSCVMGMVALLPQLSSAQPGGSAVPFLLIAPNARADGMGEAGGGLADDASAAHWNPAGLAFQTGQEVSLTHSNWLPQFQQSDLFYEYLAYKNHMSDLGGTVSGSITFLNLGEFNETDVDPTVLRTFKAYEFGITAGYATKVFDDFGLGLNIRYIRSSLAPFNVQNQNREGVASTISFDVATMWKPQNLELPLIGNIEDALSIGVNLSNLGPKLTYIDAAQADPLPTNLRLGFGFHVLKSEYNNVTIALDFNRLLVRRYPVVTDSAGNTVSAPPPDGLPKSLFSAWSDKGLKRVTIATGFEYRYGKPEDFIVAIRSGYFYEAPDNGNRKFLTFGAGIRYDVYGFDFSYLSAVEENHPLAETLRFTLSIAWGGDEE